MPPGDAPTRDVLGPVFEVLRRYVSAPTAHSIVNVARRRTGIADTKLTRDQLWEMLDAMERSLLFFLGDPIQVKSCRRALEALASASSGPAHPSSLLLAVRFEEDIARARTEAREFARGLGFSAIGQTRLMTAVSELARNIVQYAGEGRIELCPVSSPPGVEIVATDRGPGIPDVEEILSGNFRSQMGLGLGLKGVKKLAERFDIRTGPGQGTSVSALLKVV
jgi:serine/threonine-protein kinase RsbT